MQLAQGLARRALRVEGRRPRQRAFSIEGHEGREGFGMLASAKHLPHERDRGEMPAAQRINRINQTLIVKSRHQASLGRPEGRPLARPSRPCRG